MTRGGSINRPRFSAKESVAMDDRKSPDERTSPIDKDKERYAGGIDEPLPTTDDPGGARTKGYSAEPGPTPPSESRQDTYRPADPDVPDRS
jgi:hypothetical protein